MKIAKSLAETSKQPPSSRRRFLAKALPVFVYTLFFPAIFFALPQLYLDRWLGLPTLLNSILRAVLGGSLIIIGLIFILWSVRAQREIGKGTPMPLMATQKLVVQKPYLYCRNPIFFGVINLFAGISLLLNSISSLMMVFVFAVTILFYTRFIEEKELEMRFGDEYLAYKNKTPFLIPIPPIIRKIK